MKLDQPLSFPAAARRVGWADAWGGKRLRRLCLQREHQIKKRFVIRDSAGRADKITLGAITRYLPELKPARVDLLSDALRGVADELQRRQRALASEEIVKRLTPLVARLRDLESKIALLAVVDAPARKRRTRRRKRRRQGTPETAASQP